MEVGAAELDPVNLSVVEEVGRTGCSLPFSTELRSLQKVAAPAWIQKNN